MRGMGNKGMQHPLSWRVPGRAGRSCLGLKQDIARCKWGMDWTPTPTLLMAAWLVLIDWIAATCLLSAKLWDEITGPGLPGSNPGDTSNN
eukprot:1154414-Pelagomonas_calceolata.AAC.3